MEYLEISDQNVNDKEPALNDGDKWESYYTNLFQEGETNPDDDIGVF